MQDSCTDDKLRARAEFDQLCSDDSLFAEMWGDDFNTWYLECYHLINETGHELDEELWRSEQNDINFRAPDVFDGERE